MNATDAYGRPSKFDTHSQAVIEAIELGMSRSAAARSAGVDDSTVALWMRERPDFSSEVQSAKERGTAALLRRIREASNLPQHWTAAAWILERTQPESFALQHRVTIDARVVVEDISRLAAQLGLDLDPSLIDSVVAEVRQLSGESDPPARGR